MTGSLAASGGLHERAPDLPTLAGPMVFSLHEPAELERLLSSADFDEVVVVRCTRSLRLPPPAEFLWQYVASTPLAGALAAVDRQRRAALEAHVVGQWERFTQDGALIMDLELSVVTARRR